MCDSSFISSGFVVSLSHVQTHRKLQKGRLLLLRSVSTLILLLVILLTLTGPYGLMWPLPSGLHIY